LPASAVHHLLWSQRRLGGQQLRTVGLRQQRRRQRTYASDDVDGPPGRPDRHADRDPPGTWTRRPPGTDTSTTATSSVPPPSARRSTPRYPGRAAGRRRRDAVRLGQTGRPAAPLRLG